VSNKNDIKEINNIVQKIIIINEKLVSPNENIRVFIEKRDKLNIKFNELQQEIRQEKIDRDKLNKKVKLLKEKRDQYQSEIKRKIEESKKYRKKIDNLIEKLPNRTNRDLQKEFDDIEWEIQTTTLDLEEEKKLVQKAKIIGIQLNKYEKIDKQTLRIRKLRKECQKLKNNADRTHEELTTLALRSQEIHATMSSMINESKIIMEKANNLHKSYLKLKRQIKPFQDVSRELVNKKKNLLNKIKEKEGQRKKEIEKNLRKKIKSEAKIKIKNKEKLSWDEFKLLDESDLKNHK
jgi:uncharacterized coiled-coil DUF342 family protein